MAKIDEAARRRPGAFRGEAPVTLADGQTWWLPKPRARFAPDAGELGYRTAVALQGDDGYGAVYERARDLEGRIGDGGVRFTELVAAHLAMGAYLLRFNYDLGDDELAGLLQFAYDEEEDPEGNALRDAVMEVATGRAPKASGGTTGPS